MTIWDMFVLKNLLDFGCECQESWAWGLGTPPCPLQLQWWGGELSHFGYLQDSLFFFDGSRDTSLSICAIWGFFEHPGWASPPVTFLAIMSSTLANRIIVLPTQACPRLSVQPAGPWAGCEEQCLLCWAEKRLMQFRVVCSMCRGRPTSRPRREPKVGWRAEYSEKETVTTELSVQQNCPSEMKAKKTFSDKQKLRESIAGRAASSAGLKKRIIGNFGSQEEIRSTGNGKYMG